MRVIDGVGLERDDAPGDCGPAPQLQWIAIDLLRVDDSYQRPILADGKRNVAAIRKGFDWRKFAPVIVAPIAGGFFAIVDGQHRVTAAFLCGHDSVPCAVIMADRQAQADAFGAINGAVTRVSRLSLFRARLLAGDAEAMRIKAVCDAASVEVLGYKGSSIQLKPRQTMALSAIEESIMRHGDGVTIKALRAIGASAGDMSGYFRAAIIRAVSVVLADHREWCHAPALLTAFEGIDLDDAFRKAVAAAQARRGLVAGDLLQADIIAHLTSALAARSVAA